MNPAQARFIEQTLHKLTQAINACQHTSHCSVLLGRKRLAGHVIKVTLVAERDSGFAAPLASHASSGGGAAPPDLHTEHRSRSRRSGRWPTSGC